MWFIFAKLSYKTWPGKSVIHPDLILLTWQSFTLVLRLLVLSTLRVMQRMPMSTNAFVTSLAPRSKISYAQLKVSRTATSASTRGLSVWIKSTSALHIRGAVNVSSYISLDGLVCSILTSPLGESKHSNTSKKYPMMLHTKPSNKRFII